MARVYAFCRVTDDLVDGGAADAKALLDEWMGLAGRAYAGNGTGLALLNRVMEEAASARVPFTYAAELGEGMRMDLRRERYETLTDLRVYTHRVASVVGLWITELAGVRTPRVLARAGEMGHAMQLTNILRDVARTGGGVACTSRRRRCGPTPSRRRPSTACAVAPRRRRRIAA